MARSKASARKSKSKNNVGDKEDSEMSATNGSIEIKTVKKQSDLEMKTVNDNDKVDLPDGNKVKTEETDIAASNVLEEKISKEENSVNIPLLYGPEVLISASTNRPIEKNVSIPKEPLYLCEVCKMKLSNAATAMSHLTGKPHKRKQEESEAKKRLEAVEKGSKNLNETLPVAKINANASFANANSAKANFAKANSANANSAKANSANANSANANSKRKAAKESTGEKPTCSVCVLTFQNETQAEAHYAGKRHKKTLNWKELEKNKANAGASRNNIPLGKNLSRLPAFRKQANQNLNPSRVSFRAAQRYPNTQQPFNNTQQPYQKTLLYQKTQPYEVAQLGKNLMQAAGSLMKDMLSLSKNIAGGSSYHENDNYSSNNNVGGFSYSGRDNYMSNTIAGGSSYRERDDYRSNNVVGSSSYREGNNYFSNNVAGGSSNPERNNYTSFGNEPSRLLDDRSLKDRVRRLTNPYPSTATYDRFYN